MEHPYARLLAASERVSWKLEEVLPPGSKLDFQRVFLPRSLVDTSHAFLSPPEQRALNHITGNAYLNLFAFVEEYIVADILNHAQAYVFEDEHKLRAMLRFAEEEVKHQRLFRSFRTLFEESFPTPCGVLGEAEHVAGVILLHHPLAVMLTTYHLELVTQEQYRMYTRAKDEDIDPLFISLVRHHWVEEAQHAELDRLEIDAMVEGVGAAEMVSVFDDYLAICSAFDGLLFQQAGLDVDSLERAAGRALPGEQRLEVRRRQHAAYRRMFLELGLGHKRFRECISAIAPEAHARLDATLDAWAKAA